MTRSPIFLFGRGNDDRIIMIDRIWYRITDLRWTWLVFCVLYDRNPGKESKWLGLKYVCMKYGYYAGQMQELNNDFYLRAIRVWSKKILASSKSEARQKKKRGWERTLQVDAIILQRKEDSARNVQNAWLKFFDNLFSVRVSEFIWESLRMRHVLISSSHRT